VPHEVTVEKLGAALIKVFKVGGGHVQLILPVVVAFACLVVLLEEHYLIIELLNDIGHLISFHVGRAVELLVNRLFVEIINSSVELRDQLLQSFLELFGLGFLLLL
jgi:hypothetical protein